MTRLKRESITSTLVKWETYDRWASFWFLNNPKGEAADLLGSTYSKSRSMLCTVLWSLYSSWTKLWHPLLTLDVHWKFGHRMREQMVFVCKVCSGWLRATEQELCMCTGCLSGSCGQQAGSWSSCPNRGRRNPKILGKLFHSHILCEGTKSNLIRNTEGSGKRKTKFC